MPKRHYTITAELSCGIVECRYLTKDEAYALARAWRNSFWFTIAIRYN